MNTYEWATETEKELAVAGVTRESIIKHYGSVENWCNAVIKTLESHKDYEKVFGKKALNETLRAEYKLNKKLEALKAEHELNLKLKALKQYDVLDEILKEIENRN